MTMRWHQEQISDIADKIINGIFSRKSITLDCTPGGGKTGAGTLLANRLLDANLIDSVLWLVPRLSLGNQVAEAFANGFGATKERQLCEVDGQDNLFAPDLPNMPKTVGHVTTYQTVAARQNAQRFADACAARRTLLILDEVQFLNDDQPFAEAEVRGWRPRVEAVRDKAAFTLVMSGTLWRTDNKRIPFVEYQRGDGSERFPERGKFYPLCDITYTLRDAVREQAVLPTEWRITGGTARYSWNGVEQTHDLSGDGGDENSRIVRTMLSSDKYVHDILDHMVDDWRTFCRKEYESRMLVMADKIAEAVKMREYLQQRHNIACVLATSKEEAAGRQLRHFRERRQGQCLVTVAMAYVGFDCPDLTHLAYLSSIRAPSWMLQSFARVSRFDARAPISPERQHAYVYGPDDQRFREFCEWVRDQQAMGVADRLRGGNGNREPKEVVEIQDDFEPIAATTGDLAVESLNRRISPEMEKKLRAFKDLCPAAASLPYSQLYEILSTGKAEVVATGGAA